jgi:hypothetical protein
MLKNSPKAVVTTKKRNIPLSETYEAIILLASVPMTWQNQYNRMHTTAPEAPFMLLPDLENIEHIMLEEYNKKLKAKVKATKATAHTNRKGKPKKGMSSRCSTDQVPW